MIVANAGYTSQTTTHPSDKCEMCLAGLRRYYDTVVEPGKVPAHHFFHIQYIYTRTEEVPCQDQQ